MKLDDIPEKERKWIEELRFGHCDIETEIYDALHFSSDTTGFKSDIITRMSETMTECAKVIQHANAMKDKPVDVP